MSKDTIGPAIAPEDTYLPPRFKTLNRDAKPSPATLSTTTSITLSPSAADSTVFLSSTWSAPSERTRSTLLAPQMAVTVAPRRFASCTTADPTPPEAPVTNTWLALLTPARRNMFSAVP